MKYFLLFLPMFAYGLTVDGQQCPSGWSITQTANGTDVKCGATAPVQPSPQPIPQPASDYTIARAWPNISREQISLKNDESIAVRIKTGGDTGAVGRISTAITTGAGSKRTVTLSASPHDFSPSKPCAVTGHETASLRWTTIQSLPAAYQSYYCKLKPNTTYYINVKHVSCSTECSFFFSAGGE